MKSLLALLFYFIGTASFAQLSEQLKPNRNHSGSVSSSEHIAKRKDTITKKELLIDTDYNNNYDKPKTKFRFANNVYTYPTLDEVTQNGNQTTNEILVGALTVGNGTMITYNGDVYNP